LRGQLFLKVWGASPWSDGRLSLPSPCASLLPLALEPGSPGLLGCCCAASSDNPGASRGPFGERLEKRIC